MIKLKFLLSLKKLPKSFPKQHPVALKNDINPRPIGPIWGRPLQSRNQTVPIQMFTTNLQHMLKKKLQGYKINQPNQYNSNAIILGPSNSGKSSIINKLTGFISPSSRKSKTTCQNIVAIHSFQIQHDGIKKNVQAKIIDTPGTILQGSNLRSPGWQAISQSTLVFMIIDGCKSFDQQIKQNMYRLNQQRKINPFLKVFLCVNKIDKISNPHKLANLIQQSQQTCKFQSTILTSIITGKGIQNIRLKLATFSKKQLWNFTKQITNQGTQAQRLVNLLEQALLTRLHRQIPYKLQILLTGYHIRQDGLIKIEYRIKSPTDNITAVVLGKRGKNISHYVDHIRRHFAKEDKLVQIKLQVKTDKSKNHKKISQRTQLKQQKNSELKQQINRKRQIQNVFDKKLLWIS